MKKLFIILFSIQMLFAGNVQELKKGDTTEGSIERGGKQYYKVTIKRLKDVRITLTNLTGDLNLYVKTDNNPTEELLPSIRKNHCKSTNLNNEDEECRYQVVTTQSSANGHEPFVYIMVYGLEAGDYTLNVTEEEAEEIPVLTNKKTESSIEHKESKQYQIPVKEGKEVTVTLSDLTADADIRLKFGEKASRKTQVFDCRSTNSGTKVDECTVTPKKDGTLYVEVYGYEAANYSITVSEKTNNTPISLEKLKKMIENNEDVTKVNTSEITSMSNLFLNNRSFNQDISKWDVSNVTDMSRMFFSATSFNQNIGSWNVSNVKYMIDMFNNASSFNQDISKWNVSNVTNMEGMFNHAIKFNQDISSWDVSKVKNMSEMFKDTVSFSNHDLSRWNVANVITKNHFADGVGDGNIAPKFKEPTNTNPIIDKINEHCHQGPGYQADDTILCSNTLDKFSYIINYTEDVFQGVYYDKLRVNLNDNTIKTLKKHVYLPQDNPRGRVSFERLGATPIYLFKHIENGADTNIRWSFENQGKTILSFSSNDREHSLYNIHTIEHGDFLVVTYVQGNEEPYGILTDTYNISRNLDSAILFDRKIEPLQ